MRRRVQAFIDKRFFRQKYDAAKTLADFAATARDETDLDKLTARLVEVVDETMQPESVELWLKPTADIRQPIFIPEARRSSRSTERVEKRSGTGDSSDSIAVSHQPSVVESSRSE